MKKVFLLVILALLAWVTYTKYKRPPNPSDLFNSQPAIESTRLLEPSKKNNDFQSYKCDGRVYCSQMTSCEEAKYFLQNCPGVLMDGNNDGIPCEQQWCK